MQRVSSKRRQTIQIIQMLKNLLIALFFLPLFSGCLKSSEITNTCNFDACSKKAPASEIQAIQDYLTANNITNATQHCSGLFYSITTAGTGKTPVACSVVSVHYKGMRTNGSVFDDRDYTTSLGTVIPGWTIGVPLLKEAGRIRLYIPPSLGYGNTDVKDQAGNVVIPANSILIFDIDLLSVQ
jgi:FKBP-type peptidyl-prolyl cis-trans isomerase FkpA